MAFHELVDTIPATLDTAIPRGHRKPATTGAITWHHFDRDTFSLGRTEIEIPGTDQLIGLYSAERSIADAFRMRGHVGYEIGPEALKEWLRRGGKPVHLIELATRLPRAKAATPTGSSGARVTRGDNVHRALSRLARQDIRPNGRPAPFAD